MQKFVFQYSKTKFHEMNWIDDNIQVKLRNFTEFFFHYKNSASMMEAIETGKEAPSHK